MTIYEILFQKCEKLITKNIIEAHQNFSNKKIYSFHVPQI